MLCICVVFVFFFFNDTATTEIYTLSLHDALPISLVWHRDDVFVVDMHPFVVPAAEALGRGRRRSEEHTSELQSRLHLVCRLLLEKKKPADGGGRRVADPKAGRAAARSWSWR